MAIQMSVAMRNARLDAIETTLGTAARIRIYSGAGGSKSMSSTPLATTGLAAGTAGHYRLTDNAGTTTHMQGTVTATGGGGDLTVDNTSIAASQAVNITGWTFTEPGA